MKLDSRDEIGSYGLMFYNNLFSLPVVLILLLTNEREMHALREFDRWRNKSLWLCLLLTSIFGFVLNYTYFLCTKLNSPLTTTVVGALKNVLTTYLGMILFPDYSFTFLSFTGATISVVGSLMYNYIEFVSKYQTQKKEKDGSIV